ncbi:hypothetical protein [uncultured Jatrophihabitans sp.]|uniref:hypothetical protein n=1 Tax=uncultured Jatrophihabitans sp. TaxID=1610747 RepID=UPI0035C9FE1D
MTALAIGLFVIAAYAAVLAIVAITRRRVLFGRGRPVANFRLFGASAALLAVAMVLEGYGELKDDSYIGLIGAVLLLLGLAGSFSARS